MNRLKAVVSVRWPQCIRWLPRRLNQSAAWILAFSGLGGLGLAQAAELLPPGQRPAPTSVHALVGGKVVVKPGESFEPGTVLIRDGLIEGVGSNVQPPPEARVWDLKGKTVYAGLIDPYLDFSSSSQPVAYQDRMPRSTSGVAPFYGVRGGERDAGGPGPGYEIAGIQPEYRAGRHYAADEDRLKPLRQLGFTAGNLVPDTGILRGSSVLVALSDAGPNQAIIKPDVFQHVAFDTDRKEGRVYPSSLMGVLAAIRQTFLDAEHYAADHRHYQAHPNQRRRPDYNPALQALMEARQADRPAVFEPGNILMAHRAAELAREFELPFFILGSGREWRRPDLVRSIEASWILPLHFPELPKLPDRDDWTQLSLEELRDWDWAPENPALIRRLGSEMALTTYSLPDRKQFRYKLRQALDRGLSESDALAALTVVPARLTGADDLLGTIEAGKLANLTIVEGESYFDPKNRVYGVWIDGRFYRGSPGEAVNHNEDAASEAEGEQDSGGKNDSEKREIRSERVARSPLADRGIITNPPAVLVRNATIWTCGPAGRLERGDLLAVDGKITAVGSSLSVPEGLKGRIHELDGEGKHLTPGLVDAHSHSMILGGVNESTLPSTAMVRIADVVDSETEHIYRQLAGGLTVANLLHGSANPIGGQNAVIKLRDGSTPDEMIFDAAPPGIKFALGENVKQSNWGSRYTSRFPQTRMGVPTFMANRFVAARRYLKQRQSNAEADTSEPPPRRDLELEALAEIIEGERWIHCHSYRQDEILTFLRLMEEFGVKVGALQHVLEGYKVADEIARHGAGASTFSDWWAYKFEVYDAIPYNGSLMHERGVLVSFNSDSSDLARRLNLEAAKAVKYGGTPEAEALKFVTLNPARQLRIDHRVGSLEPGKDADLALWSGSPLDTRSVCLQTWIEGRLYFDRSHDAERTAARRKEREALIEKAKKALGESEVEEEQEKEQERERERENSLSNVEAELG